MHVIYSGKDMKDAMDAEQEEAEENASAGPRPVDAKGKPIFTAEEIQKKQQKRKEIADKKVETRKARVEKLSENLINKVSIFAEGAKSENDRAVTASFKEICRLEAAELVKESYGWELLQAIGRTYISKSEYVTDLHGDSVAAADPPVTRTCRQFQASSSFAPFGWFHSAKQNFNLIGDTSVSSLKQTLMMPAWIDVLFSSKQRFDTASR
jgi:hypothetical protein